MTARDGKHDPQDSPGKNSAENDSPPLFPMHQEERQKCYQRMAENLLRMRTLQTQIEASTRPQRDELARLKRSNAALLEELAAHS